MSPTSAAALVWIPIDNPAFRISVSELDSCISEPQSHSGFNDKNNKNIKSQQVQKFQRHGGAAGRTVTSQHKGCGFDCVFVLPVCGRVPLQVLLLPLTVQKKQELKIVRWKDGCFQINVLHFCFMLFASLRSRMSVKQSRTSDLQLCVIQRSFGERCKSLPKHCKGLGKICVCTKGRYTSAKTGGRDEHS